MRTFLILALVGVYAICAMARVGGHYIHILPVIAMGIYIYGLFTLKSAGVESETVPEVSTTIGPPP